MKEYLLNVDDNCIGVKDYGVRSFGFGHIKFYYNIKTIDPFDAHFVIYDLYLKFNHHLAFKKSGNSLILKSKLKVDQIFSSGSKPIRFYLKGLNSIECEVIYFLYAGI